MLHLDGMVFPATDTSVDEDDFANVGVDLENAPYMEDRNDRLTYSLSGRDAKSFRITGEVDYNSIVTATLKIGANDIPDGGTIAVPVTLSDDVPDGRLEFKKSPDYEIQPEYRVTIKATDPGNDYKYVNVRITITNVNEIPEREKPAGISHRVPYPENATKVVSTYEGDDPESPTFIYSLVDTAGPLYLGIAREIDADPDEEASDLMISRQLPFLRLILLITPCSRSTAIPVNSVQGKSQLRRPEGLSRRWEQWEHCGQWGPEGRRDGGERGAG